MRMVLVRLALELVLAIAGIDTPIDYEAIVSIIDLTAIEQV